MNSSVRGGLIFVGIRGAAGLFEEGWGGYLFYYCIRIPMAPSWYFMISHYKLGLLKDFGTFHIR